MLHLPGYSVQILRVSVVGPHNTLFPITVLGNETASESSGSWAPIESLGSFVLI